MTENMTSKTDQTHCITKVVDASCPRMRMYTRDTVREVVTKNIFDTGVNLKNGDNDVPVTLEGFQNVINLTDIGSVALDITVRTRNTRFLAFCLWSGHRIDPRINTTGTVKSDAWDVDCDVANQTEVLEMTGRSLLRKPDGH